MYLIETVGKSFVYRVWGHTETLPEALEAMLEVQSQLAEKGLPVVRPIPLPSGKYLQTLNAPEGERFAALFPFAVGKPAGRGITPEQSSAVGQLTAKVHLTTDTFDPFPELPIHDVNVLLLEPAHAIQNCEATNAKQRELLDSIVSSLSQRLETLDRTPPLFGLCHGDIHGMNVLFNEGDLSLLDFDWLSYGWRAWDLAVFVWWVRGVEDEEEVRRAFFEGYSATHPHAEKVVQAIPIFVPIRHLLLTRNIINSAERGVNVGRWIDETFIDKRLGFIWAWMRENELYI